MEQTSQESSSGRIVAVDIGGTKIAATAASVVPGQAPQLEGLVRTPTGAQQGGKIVLANIIAAITQVLKQFPNDTFAGIGVSAAGVPDEDGTIVSATDLIRGWAGTRLGSELTEHFHMPATVIGDVHAHALGEVRWGAGKDSRTTLIAAAGTGIGGAVCVGGRLLRGVHGLGGHVGHVNVAAAGDKLCSCGRRGHVETVASGSGIVAEYKEVCAQSGRAVDPTISGGDISQKAKHGENEAALVLRTAGMSLGMVLGSLANVIDPDTIVLSGSVTAAGEVWWESLQEGYASSAMDLVAPVPLVRGVLGDDAPLIGAVEAFLSSQKHSADVNNSIWVDSARAPARH